jgi:hypothetical protein
VVVLLFILWSLSVLLALDVTPLLISLLVVVVVVVVEVVVMAVEVVVVATCADKDKPISARIRIPPWKARAVSHVCSGRISVVAAGPPSSDT